MPSAIGGHFYFGSPQTPLLKERGFEIGFVTVFALIEKDTV